MTNSKAFGKLDHGILISKLMSFGIDGQLLQWFRSYLTKRFRLVYINGTYSEKGILFCGVPQGSILGPLMFCIYINDLPICVNTDCHLYADSTTLFTSDKNINAINTKLQNSLDSTTAWARDNCMAINAAKTVPILLTTKGKKTVTSNGLNLLADGKQLECKTGSKLLGLTFTDNLFFNRMADSVCKKLGYCYQLLKYAKPYVSNHVLVLLYNAYGKSILEYCVDIYGAQLSKQDIERIERLQYKIAKLFCHPPNIDDRKTLFDYLGWISFSALIKYNAYVTVFNCLNNLFPLYCNFFQRQQSNTRSTTRGDLYQPSGVQHNFGLNSISYFGIKVWEKIPVFIRTSNNGK